MHDQKDLRKCKVWAPHSHEELRVGKGDWWVVCGLLKWEGDYCDHDL